MTFCHVHYVLYNAEDPGNIEITPTIDNDQLALFKKNNKNKQKKTSLFDSFFPLKQSLPFSFCSVPVSSHVQLLTLYMQTQNKNKYQKLIFTVFF